MEKERKKQLYIALGVLAFAILGIVWSFNNLNNMACNPPVDMQNLSYPVQLDFGFNRIEMGCNTISIGDGNFDYYKINEFMIGGILLLGFGGVWFMLRDKSI